MSYVGGMADALPVGTRVVTFSTDGDKLFATVVSGPNGNGLYVLRVASGKKIVRHRDRLEVAR